MSTVHVRKRSDASDEDFKKLVRCVADRLAKGPSDLGDKPKRNADAEAELRARTDAMTSLSKVPLEAQGAGSLEEGRRQVADAAGKCVPDWQRLIEFVPDA